MSGVCFFFGMDLRLILYRKSGLLDAQNELPPTPILKRKMPATLIVIGGKQNVLLIFETAHFAVNSRSH